MQQHCLSCPRIVCDDQRLQTEAHLVKLVNNRPAGGNVAGAGLQNNLLGHPDGRLPERDVGEGSPHGQGPHLELHLHGACVLPVLGHGPALVEGFPITLHANNRGGTTTHHDDQRS